VLIVRALSTHPAVVALAALGSCHRLRKSTESSGKPEPPPVESTNLRFRGRAQRCHDVPFGRVMESPPARTLAAAEEPRSLSLAELIRVWRHPLLQGSLLFVPYVPPYFPHLSHTRFYA
jgi:hypothetical protein